MKAIITLLISLLSISNLSATHLMGGQITTKNLGGLTYEVTLTLYRDTLGIPMFTYEYIFYENLNSIGTISAETVLIHNVTNIGNGVERYQYLDTITYTNPGTYRAYYSNCCRNNAILNIPNAGNFGLYLDVQIFADTSNSSPIFMNEPITVAQLNQPFSYNPLPFDSDSDSLSWSLDVPMDVLGTVGVQIPNYILPYSDSLIPFTLDTLTGEITFLPNTVGNFQVSVKATEWRNGQPIGFIRRDMQLLVVPSTNLTVLLTTNYSTQRSTTNQPIYLEPNENFTFELTTYDLDSGYTSVSVSGSIFHGNNPSIISVPTQPTFLGGMMSTYTRIEWTPTIDKVSETPYFLVFRIGDPKNPYIFYNDYTFRIFVNSLTTSLPEIENKSDKILIKTFDILGREIDPNTYGIQIQLFSDGSKKKVYKTNL